MEISLKNIYKYIWINDGYWSCPTTVKKIENTVLSNRAKCSIIKYTKDNISPIDINWIEILYSLQNMYPNENIYFPDNCLCLDNSCNLTEEESE